MSDRYVAHVKITRSEEGGPYSILVNGEEMNNQILANTLRIDFPQEEAQYGEARVTMTLVANVELDLPDAEVER